MNLPLPTEILPKSEKILVADDEPYLREIISEWLRAEGYACAAAVDGNDAWDKLQREEYSLLLSDIKMPGRTGLELLTMTKERFPDVAVVMMTAVDDRETAIGTVQNGAYGYVIKPFEHNEVVISVENALERRRLTLASQENERRLEETVRARTAEVRRTQEEIALRLVAASEYRDEETGAHIRRIGLYASALAEGLGWDEPAVDDIRVAAPMHDIGKIGVSDAILLKPGKLTPEEFEVVKTHGEIGAGILKGSDIPLLRMAKDVALSHHERWDGSGYPHGLAGEAIPESARIVAVADVCDALVTKRVYRPALPEDEALDIMKNREGGHFDPVVFECFLDVLPEFRRIRTEVADGGGPEAEAHV